jgi:uncharacterized delta-60 repeat protein
MHLRPLPGVFTILACLIPLIFCAAFVELNASPPSWGAYAEAVFLFWAIIPAGGICLLFGFIAGRRGEPRAARVIVLSILVSVLGIAAYLPFRPDYNAEEEAKERARTWGATGSICGFVVQPDGRIVIAGAGLARLLPDGARDLTFRPDTDRGLYRRLGVCGEFGRDQLAVQPDGKILVAGNQQLSRLNPDASIDHSFAAPVPDREVNALEIQPDGRILIAGNFWHLGETLRWGIARLSPRGALDTRFQSTLRVPPTDPNLNFTQVTSFVSDSAGRVVVAGLFEVAGESGLVDLARLNPDGTLDRTFPLGRPASLASARAASLPSKFGDGPMERFVDPFGESFLTANGTPVFFTFDSAGHFVSHDFKPGIEDGPDRYGIEYGLTRFLADKNGTILATTRLLWRIRSDGKLVTRFSAEAVDIESLAFQGDRILGLARGRLLRFLPNGERDFSFTVAEMKVHR